MRWCAVAPREVYVRLENSRVWKRIDDEEAGFVVAERRSKAIIANQHI